MSRFGSFLGVYAALLVLSSIISMPLALIVTPAINIACDTRYNLLEGFVMVWAVSSSLSLASLLLLLFVTLGKEGSEVHLCRHRDRGHTNRDEPG